MDDDDSLPSAIEALAHALADADNVLGMTGEAWARYVAKAARVYSAVLEQGFVLAPAAPGRPGGAAGA